MRVACEAELDTEGRGSGKGIGVMREQDVGDVGPDQPCDAVQHGGWFASACALVVDSDQIETAAAPGQFRTLLPQQMQAVARKERLRLRFYPRRALVVAVASPDAQGRPQPAHLRDAVLQG